MAQASGSLEGYYCYRPFEFATVNEKGELYLCCPGWLNVAAGSMDGVPFDEIWNSNYAQYMRESIFDGSYKYCNDNCPYLKTRSGKIARYEDVTDPYHREIIEKRLTVLPRGPRELTVSHDPTCNLTCPSCRRGVFKHDEASRAKAERVNDKIFTEAIRDAERIEICGNGDPFASPMYLKALREFDRARFPNLKISLVTNGLRLDQKMWESISASHGAIDRIHISFNGARPETFALNQRGGDLKTLLRNMEFIAQLHRDGIIPFMSLGYYILANNYREMPEFIDLIRPFTPDGIYFTPMSKSTAHTDEEYLAEAVHKPAHPEFESFREVLNSPPMNDPLAVLINLKHLLYMDRAGRWAAPPKPEPFHTWAEFARAFDLAPEQHTPVRAFVNGLKDEAVLVLSRKPAVGPAPFDLLLQLDGQNEQEVIAKARQYAADTLEPESNLPYWHAINNACFALFPQVYKHLTVKQRDLWEQCSIFMLLDCDTGYDPLFASAHAQREPLAPVPFILLRHRLDLTAAQADAVLNQISELKQRVRHLCSINTTVGGATPLAVFASWLGVAPGRATAELAKYLADHAPAGHDPNYAALIATAETDATAAIKALLSQHQRRLLEQINLSWVACMIPSDAFAEAVQRLQELPAPRPLSQAAWPQLLESLQLDSAQAGAVEAILRVAREELTRLYAQPPRAGADAPLMLLAEGLRGGKRDAQQRFVQSLSRTQELTSGKSYDVLARALAARIREKITPLLTPAQARALRDSAQDIPLQIALPDDPLTAALSHLLRTTAPALVR